MTEAQNDLLNALADAVEKSSHGDLCVVYDVAWDNSIHIEIKEMADEDEEDEYVDSDGYFEVARGRFDTFKKAEEFLRHYIN